MVLELAYSYTYICSLIIFVATIGIFIFLHQTRYSDSRFLKKYFTVSARKSTTGAIQLGGIGIYVGNILACTLFLFSVDYSSFPIRFIVAYFVGATILFVNGYVDDRVELRPIVKLGAQVLAIFLFSIISSTVFVSPDALIAFSVMFTVGLVVINGANLLDGLDTLSIKLNLVSLMAMLIVSSLLEISAYHNLTIFMAIPFFSFYFFNKEPSRIHLGEIGGSLIGFNLLFLAVLHVSFDTSRQLDYGKLFLFAVPMILAMSELLISFSRRLLLKKSPFIGDRNHFHYVLKETKNFSASLASSYYAVGWMVISLISIAVSFISPFLSPVVAVVAVIYIQFSMAKNKWFHYKPSISFDSFMRFVSKDTITFIYVKDVDNFEFIVEKSVVEERKAA